MRPQVDRKEISRTVARALAEDVGSGDVTAALIETSATAHAELLVRESCVLCGTDWFDEVFRQLDRRIVVRWRHSDGESMAANSIVCELDGPAGPLLTGERTALNLLQTLSGTATATRRYVEAVRGTRARILDTRKTVPGLRLEQKYAVRCGGGVNHRVGLYDAVLIKENHIAAAGGLTQAVRAAREQTAELLVEVEVESLEQVREALDSGPDRLLLDNFSLADIRSAVALRDAHGNRKIELEASGGVTLETIGSIATTGIEYVSVGAITKHVRAVDFSLRFAPLRS
jgi:nicotinate-nucleotide pyrophosphorylase (carboxylating)